LNRKRLLVLALVFLPLLATAAETVTLTLDDAVRLALDNSINLKKSAIDLAEAGYSASRLWSEIFPSFSLSTSFTFLPATPLITDPGFQYRDNVLSYTVSLGLSLSLNPSINSSMKRIELAYRAQLLSYENASKQLEIQVIKRFLNLIAMNANISYIQGSLDLALQKMNSDRVARANGLLSELAWLNSQLSAETARYNLLTAQNTYKNSLGEFLAILGIEDGTNVILNGTVEIARLSLDPEKLILEYLPKRPDIVAQRQTIERLELNKNITTNNSRSPTLNLSTQWRGGTPTPHTGGGLSAPFTDSLSGSLSLSIPIDSWIPGTKQNQNIRAVNAEVEKARLELQNTETQAKNQIRLLVSNLNSRWESLEIARLRVSIAQRTVDATAIGFRNGTVEFRELEDRRSDLSNASQRLLEEELSYQSLLLDLAAALNVEWRSLTGQFASGISGSQK
jgi:outer membrane protein, multidrug efflux system